MAKTRAPAVDGWFAIDAAQPHLIGSQCTACSTVFFPPGTPYCRNPGCAGSEMEPVPLSTRGRIWSYTNAGYPPPAPFVVTTEPFEPFCIAAVELDAEQLVVLGQVVGGVEVGDLRIGQEVELVLDTLFADNDTEHVVWKWRPLP